MCRDESLQVVPLIPKTCQLQLATASCRDLPDIPTLSAMRDIQMSSWLIQQHHICILVAMALVATKAGTLTRNIAMADPKNADPWEIENH